MNSQEKLLLTVKEWWSEYKKTHRTFSDNENIFDILEISHKEVIMCRMLAYLLRNSRSNLAQFINCVLKAKNLPDNFAINASVEKEYLIPNTDRRIDLAIYTKDYFIPIEVKIYAEDKKSQCYDYYQYADAWNKKGKTQLYYLTVDGKLPSAESLSKKVRGQTLLLTDDDYSNLSWSRDIVGWLNIIINNMDVGNEKIIAQQYLEAVEKMSGKAEQEKKTEIVNLLTQNTETFQAALLIGKNIDSAKSANAQIFMQYMEKAMESVASEFHLKLSKSQIYPCKDFTFKEPHFIKYEVMHLDNGVYVPVEIAPEKYLWFVVGIDWRLYVGFAVYDAQNDLLADNAAEFKECIEKYLNVDNALHTYEGGNFVMWDYLCAKKEAPFCRA